MTRPFRLLALVPMLILSSPLLAAPVTQPSVAGQVKMPPMHFADAAHGAPFAKDPAVVHFGGRYLLYYTLRTKTGFGIGVAESRDIDHWTKIGEVPPVQEVEKNGICAPGAIVLNGKVHLFYQSYGNGPKDAICHATSADGLHFDRDPSNPVFRPTGDWNCGRAIDADVIEHDGKLLLYWATRDPAFKVQQLGVAAAPIDSDFGRASWTQLGPDGPILKPELPWEKQCIEAPALFTRGGKLFMFYAGAYNNEPQQIGLAQSTDGVRWERVSDEPILPNGKPGTWNSSESGHPYAFTDQDGTVHLFYQGNDDGGKTWYLSRAAVGWANGKAELDLKP